MTPVGSDGKTYTIAVTGMAHDGTVIVSVPAGKVHDEAGNANVASTSTDNTVTYDITPPTVTINQATGQADPTNSTTINFTAVFSEAVVGFATGDVTIAGTAGAATATVTPVGSDGTTYNVAVTGMTHDGTVIVSLAAGVADDPAGNPNVASTSTDNSVTYDITPPAVTIDQAAGQADPTIAATVNFPVVFSEPVIGFAASHVTISGTAGATTATVTPVGSDGTTYNVAVTGMAHNGTVVISMAPGAAHDQAGNLSLAPTIIDNSVAYYGNAPGVTINQATSQADPTNASPITFTVAFDEPVTGFATGDVTVGGSAGATTATVTPVGSDGTTYNVAVTGMTQDGLVVVTVPAGVAQDQLEPSQLRLDRHRQPRHLRHHPTDGDDQPGDRSSRSGQRLDRQFHRGVQRGGCQLCRRRRHDCQHRRSHHHDGDSRRQRRQDLHRGRNRHDAKEYGTITASLAQGVVDDAAGNPNVASTSTDNSVTYDNTAPTVTIDKAAGQADPTNAATINFAVVFSEPVIGFTTGHVAISGTAGATTAVVTPVGSDGTTYNVAVTGMTGDGTVIINMAAGAAHDAPAIPAPPRPSSITA